MIITGATGSRVHPIKTVHVSLQEELAEDDSDPATTSKPFDANRKGMVVGEGAGAFLLEELASAEKRGANVLAEVLGYGSSAVIDRNSIAKRGQAVANAMRQALNMSNLKPDDIGHVNAHGLSTVKCDREEAQAISEVMSERSSPVPVVAPKSYFGNLGAGSGCIELISSIQAMQHGKLFPTLNYTAPDPECPISVVSSQDVDAGKTVLNVNVTPQGQASALVVRSLAP